MCKEDYVKSPCKLMAIMDLKALEIKFIQKQVG